MIAMILTEAPQFRLATHRGGPIRLLARHNGVYSRPIVAHAVDFRFEDNPDVPRQLMALGSCWIAKHPLEELYVAYGGDLLHSRATWEEVEDLKSRGELPPDVYEVAAGWWEWVVALDRDYNIIKAAKRCRPGEPTPEQVDEAPRLQLAGLAERLDRLMRTAP